MTPSFTFTPKKLTNLIFGPNGYQVDNSVQDAEKKSRYSQVQGKTTEQLSAMGIIYQDGTYWKDGMAWLTKNDIDSVTGKYNSLLDSSGNYMYPLDIPSDIMLAVVNRFGYDLTKEHLILIAQKTFQITGGNLTDSSIQGAIDVVAGKGITPAADMVTGTGLKQVDTTTATTAPATSTTNLANTADELTTGTTSNYQAFPGGSNSATASAKKKIVWGVVAVLGITGIILIVKMKKS